MPAAWSTCFIRATPKRRIRWCSTPSGTDTAADHNPELSPGDTVQVSRAGLVYVVGDVIRPGGFPVDPVQGLTVVQALSLAWGPSQNAAAGQGRAHPRAKGRPHHDRPQPEAHVARPGSRPADPGPRHHFMFPTPLAKNLLNRTMESAIQSTIGVTIYSALVYSQRY